MSDENKQGVLSLTIKDRAVLYAAYMPFVEQGGLFVPTNKKFELGEEVFICSRSWMSRRRSPLTVALFGSRLRARKAIDRRGLACSFLTLILSRLPKLKIISAPDCCQIDQRTPCKVACPDAIARRSYNVAFLSRIFRRRIESIHLM